MARSRVYFITDVHGSNKCFRKFLNAAKFYKADVLILGGDITGKVMAPIVESGGRFRCTYQGAELVMTSVAEVEEFRKKAGILEHTRIWSVRQSSGSWSQVLPRSRTSSNS